MMQNREKQQLVTFRAGDTKLTNGRSAVLKSAFTHLVGEYLGCESPSTAQCRRHIRLFDFTVGQTAVKYLCL